MSGPPPKRGDQRRRRNIPKTQEVSGVDTTGVAVDQPPLGFDAHDLVVDLYAALAEGVEGKFYSAADWQRARIELHFLNGLLLAGRVPGAQAWTAVQAGFNALLVSPADKRRTGIELQRKKVDPDEDAAVLQMAEYAERLGG